MSGKTALFVIILSWIITAFVLWRIRKNKSDAFQIKATKTLVTFALRGTLVSLVTGSWLYTAYGKEIKEQFSIPPHFETYEEAKRHQMDLYKKNLIAFEKQTSTKTSLPEKECN